MSDTPETDSVRIDRIDITMRDGGHLYVDGGMVSVEHARKLERERDEAREQNEEQARLLAMSADREEKLRTELQQARDCFSAAMELAERYKAERDAMP